ncbi:MAG: ribonuclease P protein subunit [Candidatus Methanomethylicia archaeon]|jgi:ribonuclease P protein subunit POP4|nr:ribonuclease P protein subunit [Candidatus Methanomethylicia archaeon]MCQ5373857.1 ribonuclease P protein subunit [Candidatus Methanomethylicia archaeon]
MNVNPSNLIYHDLVGLPAKVEFSSDPTQIGLEGMVVDETKNMLVLFTSRGCKKVSKRNSLFTFYIPQPVSVDGTKIAYHPAERLKRIQRRKK